MENDSGHNPRGESSDMESGQHLASDTESDQRIVTRGESTDGESVQVELSTISEIGDLLYFCISVCHYYPYVG